MFIFDDEMITIYSNGSALVPVASQTIGNISDINLSKHRVLYNRESKLFIGKLLGWADILLKKLSQGYTPKHWLLLIAITTRIQ